MIDIIIDTLLDCIKLIPFLFVAFIIIELVEHKLTKKSKNIISNSKKLGPIFGSLLGTIPQCGFSVLATNLYITRIISLGTLIAIYLSTSDEMLPILLGEKAPLDLIIKILLLKIIIGVSAGIIIDFIVLRRNKKKKEEQLGHYDICEEEHCHCEKGIIKSALIHTLKTITFLLIITFILNLLFAYLETDILNKIFMKESLLTPFITSLIGLIPNCASSIMITELFLKEVLSFPSLISGLLTGSGVAILVLFKQNKNIKENIRILLMIYFIGSLSGVILELLKIAI